MVSPDTSLRLEARRDIHPLTLPLTLTLTLTLTLPLTLTLTLTLPLTLTPTLPLTQTLPLTLTQTRREADASRGGGCTTPTAAARPARWTARGERQPAAAPEQRCLGWPRVAARQRQGAGAGQGQ